jgi:hypothetical protein
MYILQQGQQPSTLRHPGGGTDQVISDCIAASVARPTACLMSRCLVNVKTSRYLVYNTIIAVCHLSS